MNDKQHFHTGELVMQKRAGTEKEAELISERMIAGRMSTQQMAFFPLLNILFVASIDNNETPNALLLYGHPGFVTASDEYHLHIKPLNYIGTESINDLEVGQSLGILGLEFDTRRRNRITGFISHIDAGKMIVKVVQAFGNCPKYIQRRKLCFKETNIGVLNTEKRVSSFIRLDVRTRQFIQNADTFFIATCYIGNRQQSADISHRGGLPGFVKIHDDKTISFDDFVGNKLYMTLGNLISHPVAALLFVDFKTGDVLHLVCHVDIKETPKEKHARNIIMTIDEGRLIHSGLPVTGELLEYSPFILR